MSIALQCCALGLVPVAIASYRMIAHSGWSVWLLSPLLAFGFCYLMAFGVRPTLDEYFHIRLIPGASNPESYQFAHVLGMLGAWSFALFSMMLPDNAVATTSKKATSTKLMKSALAVALVLGLAHAFFAYQAGALTLSIAQNRLAYLNSLIGGGQVLLSRDASFVALGLGLVLAPSWRSTGLLGLATAIIIAIPNALVSSRSALTQLVFLVLMVAVVQSIRNQKLIKATWLAATLGVLTLVGLLLGYVRGVDEQAGGALQPVVFFSQTFDMAESLELSVSRIKEPHYGITWAEDMVYTYIPRAVFPSKPMVYGATRLQAEVYPELTPPGEVPIGTFPVGAWGEAYANFGPVGVLIALGALGLGVKALYRRALGMVPGPAWVQACAIILYSFSCANGLSYTRGIGQFLSGLIYLCALFGLVYAASWLGSSLVRSKA